jgi:hypothetical protein
MSRVPLFKYPATEAAQRQFNFDHAMAHRDLMQVMGPLNQWSTMPYFIEPRTDLLPSPPGPPPRPAVMWNMDHQQAHDDFNRFLPAHGRAAVPGIPSAQVLVDTNFADQTSLIWWTHANSIEHLTASNAITPLSASLHDRAALPWWLQGLRWVLNYW